MMPKRMWFKLAPHVCDPDYSKHLSSSLGSPPLHIQKEAPSLCVIFDSELLFDFQLAKVTQSVMLCTTEAD